MMKRFLRLILPIFLLMLTVALSACVAAPDTGDGTDGSGIGGNTGGTSGNDGTDGDTDSGGEVNVQDMIKLAEGGECSWCIVYPTGCEGYVYDAALSLAKKIRAVGGIEVPVISDAEDCCGKGRIVVGKTDDDNVREVFEGTRYHDYGVTPADDCIIIAAYSKNSYIKAVEYIEGALVATSGDAGVGLYLPRENFMDAIKTSYDISAWTVCGTPLTKYKIVYEDGLDVDTVRELRDRIAKACGAYVEIMSDSECDESEHEILIGNTSRSESNVGDAPLPLHYSASVIGGKLVIRSGGMRSLPLSLIPLFETLTEGKDEIIMDEGFASGGDIFSDPLDSSYAEGTDLRVMSCNILAEYESWSLVPEHYPYLPVHLREEIFFAALDYYQPTIVGLQELSPAWYNAIENNYHDFDKWELLKFENPNRADGEYVFSTIMYRTDLYTVTDSGMSFFSKHNNARGHCYTWAVFKMIETGREFCFVSTHWDGTGREHGFLQSGEFTDFVNLMQQKYPVFTTGDFNCNELSPEFIEFLENSGSVDSKHAALQQMNNVGSWHNFTKDDLSWGSCDHITATKESTVLKFQTLYENEIIFASDHCWLIADIKIGQIGENDG